MPAIHLNIEGRFVESALRQNKWGYDPKKGGKANITILGKQPKEKPRQPYWGWSKFVQVATSAVLAKTE